MSLPEGALRDAINGMFGKALPVFDDLALVEVVGRSLIGRLRFGQSAEDLDQVPAQNLRELLDYRGTAEIFRDLLERFARYSGGRLVNNTVDRMRSAWTAGVAALREK